MGKGDNRRPTFVSEDELQTNVDRIFGERPRRQYVPPPLKIEPCTAEMTLPNCDSVRCRLDAGHAGPHNGIVFGRRFKW